MSQIKYLGGLHGQLQEGEIDVYQSADPGNLDETKRPRTILVGVGETADVSEQKARQIADDFPAFFEIDGKKPGGKAKARAAGVADVPADDK